jgi:hypothetical protein
MYKKNALYICCCLISVFTILFLLFTFAYLPNRKKNGFNRHFLSTSLTKSHENSFLLETSRISGISKDRYYITGQNPGWMLILNKDLKVIDTLIFNVRQINKFLAPNTIVDSPNIYMYAGNLSYLIKGKLDKKTVDLTALKTPVFVRTAQISPQLLVVRGFDSSNKKQVFKKINCNDGSVEKEAPLISDDKAFGMSTDGTLLYDNATNALVYVEFYKNDFICIDTNLNLIYKGKTIDTTNNFDLIIHKESADSTLKVTPGKNREEVNITATIYNKQLYVISALKADNEDEKVFRTNWPVDIYSTENGKYIGSIYIPKATGKKIKSINISGNGITVLYDDLKIISYLPPNPVNWKNGI